jgi:hypothetical protein
MIKFISAFIVTIVVAWFCSVHIASSHFTAFVIPSTTFPVTYLAVGFVAFFLMFHHMLRSK